MKQRMLVPEPQDPTPTVQITVDTTEFCCPFCLYKGDLTKFYVRIKKGYSDKQFKCPDCGQIMRKETLTKKMSITEYAHWVYDTKAWERIKYSTWKQRLKDYKWNWQFWTAYKQHKAEMSEGETYEQHLERQQQEQHEEEINIHDEEDY